MFSPTCFWACAVGPPLTAPSSPVISFSFSVILEMVAESSTPDAGVLLVEVLEMLDVLLVEVLEGLEVLDVLEPLVIMLCAILVGPCLTGLDCPVIIASALVISLMIARVSSCPV